MKHWKTLLAAFAVLSALTVAGAGGGSALAAPAALRAGAHTPFVGSAARGRQAHGRPFEASGGRGAIASHASGGGPGFLAVFQEESSGTLAISVGGAAPVDLSSGAYTYGLIPAGTYTVTASRGGVTVATGSVTVGTGQYVTALVYLAVGGTPTVSGFVNDRSEVPVGQSRIVFRNTANAVPLDFYLNGTKVASALANVPPAPHSTSVVVPSGPLTIAAVPAGHPESDALYSESGVLLPGDLFNLFAVGDAMVHPSTVGFLTNATPLGIGYRLYASDGGVFDFGNAQFYGSTATVALNRPIVGADPTSVGLGYRLVAADGGIFSFGDAQFYGSTGSLVLNKPVVGMASTHDDGGYWLVASDGGIFAFGDASFYGSTGSLHLNQPIVGMAATPDGRGYWLAASDGGVFSFGDASFYGSTGSLHLNQPIVATVSTVDGKGYWLVAADGGVFAFGDASFYGSTGSLHLNQPIVAGITTPDSLGYWLVAADGGVFSFGDAGYYGSTGSIHLNKPIVAASAPGAPLPN